MMDILNDMGFTSEIITQFILTGFIFNIIGNIITLFAVGVRGSNLNPRDLDEYNKFMQQREFFIENYVKGYILLLKPFEILVPFQSFIMCLALLYYLKKYKGLYGLTKARIFIDRYCPIPIVKYKVVPLPQDK